VVITRHERIQHAVGHGGFHTALLQFGRAAFRYVYDCGAKKSTLLPEVIREYSDSLAHDTDQVDLLVLSHLDDDHVNGVDQLLGQCHVDTVVLPYLGVVERAFVAARSARRGRLTATGREFIADPGPWLRGRGVGRVIFARGGASEPDTEERSEEAPRDTENVTRLTIPWGRLTTPAPQRDPAKLRPDDRVLPHSRSLPIQAGHVGGVIWLLKSHVFECSDTRRSALERAARRAFGVTAGADLETAITPELLLDTLKSTRRTDQLIASFARIWSDRNLTSLCLYSGPENASMPGGTRGWRSDDLTWTSAAGWLGTGDAALDVAARRQSLIRHLGPLIGSVGSFCLPHHGSQKNFHLALLDEFAEANSWIAAVPRRSKHHPARSVIRRVLAAGRQFVRVGEHPHERLIERFDLL